MDTAKSRVLEWWEWLVARWTVEDTVLTDGGDQLWWVIGIIVGLIAVMQTPLWTKGLNLKLASTIIHEMGHVIVAKVFRRKLQGIKVHGDSSGVTSSSSSKNHGIGMLFTVLAGYPAPALLGLAFSFFGSIGYAGASLLVYNVILVFALLLCRNVVGFVATAGALIATGAITVWNQPDVVSWTVIVLVIFYGLSALQDIWDLFTVHYGHFHGGLTKDERAASKENKKTSDAHQAFQLTMIPATVWILFFAAVSVVCFVVSMTHIV